MRIKYMKKNAYFYIWPFATYPTVMIVVTIIFIYKLWADVVI